MVKKIVLCFFIAVFLSGCATTGRSATKQELSSLQMKISQLEKEIYEKDKKISDLEYEINKSSFSQTKTNYSGSSIAAQTASSHSKTNKNIQKALKKAGLYDGAIDSKIGPKTKRAIMEFQISV